MPLDTAAYQAPFPATTLFRHRRQAAAAIWLSIPAPGFKMRQWECGTAACALGWLARYQFDGWIWACHQPRREPDVYQHPYDAAASYFDISLREAMAVFGSGKLAEVFYCSLIEDITAAQVAKALLQLP